MMRRVVALLLTACLMCGLLVASSYAQTANPAEIHDFHEIPGVTNMEIVAIEMLRTKYKGFTYGMLDSTETFQRLDGTYGGYSALFCAWMSRLFGFEFTPRIYQWDDLIDEVERGQVDFTGELATTGAWGDQFYVSDTFTERTVKAFRRGGSEKLSELAKTRSLRFGFLKSASMIDVITSSAGQSVDVTLLGDVEQATTLLAAGEIDAIIAEQNLASAFSDDVVMEDVFPVVYSPMSLTTANRELRPIISVFNKYLEHGGIYQFTELYNQGNREYLEFKLLSRLTDDEKACLTAHQQDGEPVRVLAESDAYPYSFYNRQEQAWQGIAFDVLNEIAELFGLEYEVVNPPGEEWANLLDRAKRGESAMMTHFIASDAHKQDYIWTDDPYAQDYYALLSRVEYEDISINQVLYSKIGLVQDSAYADVFRKWFPSHTNVVEYETSDDGFAALEDGHIGLLMASHNLLLSATNYDEKPGYKANLVFDRTFDIYFGFNKEEQTLCSLIGKAQKLVDTQTIADRWTRKVYDYRGKFARQQVPYLIGLLVLLFAVLTLLTVLILRNKNMNRRLESTVQERTAELVIASQAKSDFLARMSHEIRTPLNAIMGMARIARQSAEHESPRTVKSIDELTNASTHLLGILNDVLDMSKIEAGKFVLAEDGFAMLNALREIESIIAQRCAEKEIALHVQLDSRADAWVIGDKLRLKQVLINLLGNAVKFTDRGGRIELKVEATSDDRDAVSLRFTVADDGIGMNDAQMARLFVAFEQADGSIASRYGGTGLGLAISQNLVGLMGGVIEVASELGTGSTFTFALRFIKTEAPSTQLSDGVVASLDLTGKRILLVEDIEINRLILLELLGPTHVAIDEAADGAQAVKRIESAPVGYYDLIFMDIMMPNMNGYDATRSIRALPRPDAASVPIIAMTANAYREDIDKAIAAGMDGHLAKPIDIDEVKRLLADRLTPAKCNML